MAKAVDLKENSVPSKITGENEEYCMDVKSNSEATTSDTNNTAAKDTILSLTAGVPTELKVDASILLERKFINMEALDTGIKWGYSNSTQSFDLFKSQFFALPIGAGISIWLLYDNPSGTADVAIGELS